MTSSIYPTGMAWLMGLLLSIISVKDMLKSTFLKSGFLDAS